MAAGGAIAAVGAAIVALFLGWPLARVIDARSWVGTPCVIEHCALVAREHRDRDGRPSTTWSVDTRYHYVVDGTGYMGTRFELGPFVGGGRAWREDAIARARGELTLCWVDPDDRGQAVLERGLDPGTWWALLGLVPIGVGGVLVGVGVRSRRGRLRRLRDAGYERSAFDGDAAGPTGPVATDADLVPVSRLVEDPYGLQAPRVGRTGAPPAMPRTRQLSAAGRRSAGEAAGALVLAGLLYVVFLRGFAQRIGRGLPEGWSDVPGLVLLAMLLGLALRIGWRVWRGRAPMATLTIDPSAMHPGATVPVRWALPTARVTGLEISLAGEEIIRHDGKRARFERRGLAPILLARIDAPALTGVRNVTIPGALMHSCGLGAASVRWWLEVRLAIPQALDACDRYPLEIHPCAPAGGA